MTTHPTPVETAAGLSTGDDEVLRTLLYRRDADSRPGARDDGHRIALVVSGGGMRGAYAGGMAHALEDAGLTSAFDVIYGSSAGAYVGAALMLGHGADSARIFYEDMACREFIDPRRIGRGRPMVSLDHLIGHILTVSKPTPWHLLGSGPVPLRVIATAVDDMTPHVLQPRTPDEWKLAMRATAAIPRLAGAPIELHGRRWIDGSVAEPIPILRALADGATHVLALLTRTMPELRRTDPGSARLAGWVDRLAPGLGAITNVGRHGPVLAVLDDAAHPSRGGAQLMAVTPGQDLGVRGLTIDPILVRRATIVGYTTMAVALDRAGSAPLPDAA